LAFTKRAEAVSASVTRIDRMADLPGAVSDYLAARNLPSDLLVSVDPRFDSVPWDDRPTLEIRRGAPGMNDLVMMSHAHAAVAETGSLVMVGDKHNPYMASFVPETAIVVLPKSSIGGGLETAWADLGPDKAITRALTFVTGPSRTGDIALQIELGAHGPRRVHIVIVDDDGDEEEPKQ
jgi:L-lactate dehydrogenase complex protein LldG